MRRAILVILILVAMITISSHKAYCENANQTQDSPFKWLRDLVDRVSEEAYATLKHTLVKAYYILISLARILYLVLGLAGSIAWFSGFSPYKGRKMVIGALILAILTEIITRFNIAP